MSVIIGYARVSSKTQSTDNQIEDLKAKGATKIFEENVSGKATNDRTQLKAMIDYVREGDTVIVMRLDRLARNTIDALNIAKQLKEKQVVLKIMDIGGDTDINSGAGRLIFTTLSAVAEMERERINERTERGREAARAKGVRFGRKPSIDSMEILNLQKSGMGASAIAKKLNISRASVYRLIEKETK